MYESSVLCPPGAAEEKHRVRRQAKPLQRESGRYRVRTSDLLLVRDAQEGGGGTQAVKADADLACRRDAFVEWLSAGCDGVWTG